MPLNKVLCSDTFYLIKDIEDNSINCIIFDPLFDIEIEKYKFLVSEIYRVFKDSGCVYSFMNWKRICECKSILSEKLNIVLDLFSGSGVVSEVCSKLKRNSIAFEIDRKRVQIAKERIENWVIQK